ncbi:MAG: F0F1 ATP synthase subunit A [Streptosporangiales bacterium]|nr:F0F1 ATP synthase subunit A [Streptosporangiales bacterium]
MTGEVAAAASGGCHLFSGCGFPAPGLQDFNLPPIFSIGGWGVTKPQVLAVLVAIAVIGFFWAAFRKPKMIPGKTQSLGEMAILAVRDQVIRPQLGKKGDKFWAYMVALFFFILLCNWMELIPVLQFPVMSRFGFVVPLVAIMYITYWYHGFKTKGFFGYFKSWFPDAPLFIMPLLGLIEILKYVIIQPATLAIRLFANMFAGHLLLSIFMVATWYLMGMSIGLVYAVGSLAMVFFVFLLELLVGLLQAFIFTTLISSYLADSLEYQH